jgi:hypothetical protein
LGLGLGLGLGVGVGVRVRIRVRVTLTHPNPNPDPNPNQVITVQLISFPLWVDSWWCLHSVRHMLVDGVSVSQLYEMRSEKEERRAGAWG